jgi:hypothetical protein
MISKISKKTFLPFIICLVMAYLLFPSNLHNYLIPMNYNEDLIWKTLDPSWNLTINYVNLKELIWGKEFVFTFGPLGYLSTKFLWGVNKYCVLLFDLFVSINFFILFYKLIINSDNKILSYILVLSITLVLPTYFGSSIALVLFSFLIFWIFESILKFSCFNYLFQSIIVILLFFIKINTGIIGILFFLIGLFYNLLNNKNRLVYFFIMFVPFIGVYLLSMLLNVDLYNYIINSLELIKGYNDIQYLDIEENKKYFYLTLPLLVVLLSLFLFELKKGFLIKDKIKTIFVFFNLGALWFIVYKQAFVRADVYHIVEYFITSNLILSFVFYLYNKKHKIFLTISAALVLLINTYMVKTQTNQFETITEKISKHNYIDSFKEYNKLSGLRIFPNNNQFPSKITSIINKNSIDVYPWNSYMLLENKLNFKPRPVFQSYTTYTKKLQELNFHYYNDKNAPDYVIYDTGATDERYSFHDDIRLNLTLIKNYQVKDTFSYKKRNLLLLEKNKIMKKVEFKKIKEYAILAGDPIIPKKDIFYEVELFQNIYGKINTLFFHSPPIKLEIFTDDGKMYSHRTSNELLKAGIFSEHYISNTDDFKVLLQNKKNEKKIISYIVNIQERDKFREKIKITEYKIIH